MHVWLWLCVGACVGAYVHPSIHNHISASDPPVQVFISHLPVGVQEQNNEQ